MKNHSEQKKKIKPISIDGVQADKKFPKCIFSSQSEKYYEKLISSNLILKIFNLLL